MRKTSEVTEFPFLSKAIRYYTVKNNILSELGSYREIGKDIYACAKNGECSFYATWHGNYRTDMFWIDDIYEFGLALGLESPAHEHEIIWEYAENPDKSAYATINIEFKCGCTFDTMDSIPQLQRELLRSKGWEMSASYLGRCNGKYTVRVKKKQLLE